MIQIEVYRPATAEEPSNRLMVDNEDLPCCLDWNQANKIIHLLNSLNYKGFNDWRLQTKEELNEIYIQKNRIGGFAYNYYWSSTEDNEDYAWGQDFSDGSQYRSSKVINGGVRCVRSI